MLKNWQTILLSIALAVFTWFLVTGREVVETWVDMPVVMTNPPEGLIIEDGLVDKIQIRLRGPKGLVGNLASQNLAYPVNVSNLKVGEQVVDIDPAKIPLSSTYEIIEVRPNRLRLKVDRRISKEIAVEAAWAGNLNGDYKLQEVVASPDVVTIRGPETQLRKISKTRVVLKGDFPEDVPRSWAENVALEVPDEIEALPGQVNVEAFFTAKTREIWIKVPIDYQDPEGFKASIHQRYVRLLIEGPVFLFHDDEYRKSILASVAFGGNPAEGKFELNYDVTLPQGCRLEKKNPETVTVVIKKN